MTTRRSFMLGLGALVCAPAIVRATSLMPVKALLDEKPWEFVMHVDKDDWLVIVRSEAFAEDKLGSIRLTDAGWKSLQGQVLAEDTGQASVQRTQLPNMFRAWLDNESVHSGPHHTTQGRLGAVLQLREHPVTLQDAPRLDEAVSRDTWL